MGVRTEPLSSSTDAESGPSAATVEGDWPAALWAGPLKKEALWLLEL